MNLEAKGYFIVPAPSSLFFVPQCLTLAISSIPK